MTQVGPVCGVSATLITCGLVIIPFDPLRGMIEGIPASVPDVFALDIVAIGIVSSEHIKSATGALDMAIMELVDVNRVDFHLCGV